VGDAAGERPDCLEALRALQALLRFGTRLFGAELACDIEERDHDVRDDSRRVRDRTAIRADVDDGAIRTTDHDVVGDDDLLLLERTHERHPLLGIRRTFARQDAVRLGVATDRCIVPTALPHDLGKRAVRVHELAARGTRDPYADGQIVRDLVNDLVIGRTFARHPTWS